MQNKTDSTVIAFLLAFQDLKTSLSKQEKQKLKEVAKQLNTQPKAWENYTKKLLLEMIAANSELDRSFQYYKTRLDNIKQLPSNLLPNEAETNKLNALGRTAMTKGFKPKTEASGYESQINNVVIVVGSSEAPEETVKNISFLEKVKEFLQ
ncbi:MAG: hypothetical protein CLLPBCKN_004338 [Chroococcidiopsis cubana SAG 39.79]|uniref:Uncharacterized protein n=1 Tax=Chroococcidiopsis cubana SAG 39.79 TaxID=388085 RepID=A0AB37ULT9_9CYAN|nr:hypothetical protein [Chroococcidiopsis cubana]MDZ4874942.1 hypothetical protein [Chroococcidiopsis cubana SAG 39.79]PSB65390.1 hypothetical protein C7B79_05655 [Chroococcidiopsis cubana CCALA 043]RUT12352.1 hypothetical protein DSM107010_23620 [Chroococcidiopsis cubana SAG 39.79]